MSSLSMDSGKKIKPYKRLSRLFLWGQKQIERGAWFLAPLSWIWGFFSFLRHTLYDHHFLPTYSVSCPVISVGNIVVGGTGKTPLVHLLAKTFSEVRVAILSRGYGAVPDEAWLLQRKLPQAKVYIGKDRYKSAKQAVQEGAELLILDDGFQHRRLARDWDLVLLDGKDPFGKGHYLPWGYLRDSPRRLSQATALFIDRLHPDFPDAIEVRTKAVRIVGQGQKEIASLEGEPCGVFCGLAKPQKFLNTLQEMGVEIRKQWLLADHEPADLISLELFAKECQVLGACFIVCTEKDAIKLPEQISLALPLVWIEIETQVVSQFEQWEKLIAKIRKKIDNRLCL